MKSHACNYKGWQIFQDSDAPVTGRWKARRYGVQMGASTQPMLESMIDKRDLPPRDLPPDPEEMNDSRAEWAAVAVRAFQKATGTDPEDLLSDLLCDLRHWADRNGETFATQLERANRNYLEETQS